MNKTLQLFDLKGKRAVITGGSRGLGLQMAEALGDMGAELMLAARKADELAQAQAQLQSRGIRVHVHAGDQSKPDQIHALVDAAVAAMGGVDILINNAGASWGAPAEDHSLEAWQKLVNLNLTAVFLLSQEIGKRCMIPQGHGRILNIASITGLRGNPPGTMKTLAYNTTKGGLVNFTRALAGEWGAYGITVNALAPGFFPSRMTQGTLELVGEQLARAAPLQRLGDGEDLKGATLLFCSDAGKHITGQILAVDGGVMAA